MAMRDACIAMTNRLKRAMGPLYPGSMYAHPSYHPGTPDVLNYVAQQCCMLLQISTCPCTMLCSRLCHPSSSVSWMRMWTKP